MCFCVAKIWKKQICEHAGPSTSHVTVFSFHMFVKRSFHEKTALCKCLIHMCNVHFLGSLLAAQLCEYIFNKVRFPHDTKLGFEKECAEA